MTMEYELYRRDRDDLGGHVTVYIEGECNEID